MKCYVSFSVEATIISFASNMHKFKHINALDHLIEMLELNNCSI